MLNAQVEMFFLLLNDARDAAPVVFRGITTTAHMLKKTQMSEAVGCTACS